MALSGTLEDGLTEYLMEILSKLVNLIDSSLIHYRQIILILN